MKITKNIANCPPYKITLKNKCKIKENYVKGTVMV